MLIFVYSLCTEMEIEIPVSPEVGEKIRKLFTDAILKPSNMELINIEALSETAVLVYIDWQPIGLSDLFFLGYWTNYASQLKK